MFGSQDKAKVLAGDVGARFISWDCQKDPTGPLLDVCKKVDRVDLLDEMDMPEAIYAGLVTSGSADAFAGAIHKN